ncbi:unnamed protein product [Rotaria magnacalcarata]|uniref:Peptidase A2 domain-containing protein n=2 Tax=Rotaria magnacalcarata TaxID=392030 RepID=A0A816S6K3_9BILA|nr:unnamed protein product [Rotaria magnacalcarata]
MGPLAQRPGMGVSYTKRGTQKVTLHTKINKRSGKLLNKKTIVSSVTPPSGIEQVPIGSKNIFHIANQGLPIFQVMLPTEGLQSIVSRHIKRNKPNKVKISGHNKIIEFKSGNSIQQFSNSKFRIIPAKNSEEFNCADCLVVKDLGEEDLKICKCYYDTLQVPTKAVCTETDLDQIILNNTVLQNTVINAKTKISGLDTCNSLWKIKHTILDSNIKSVQWNVSVNNESTVKNTTDITEVEIQSEAENILFSNAPSEVYNVFNYNNKVSFNVFNGGSLLFANCLHNYLLNFKNILNNFNNLPLLQHYYIKVHRETIVFSGSYIDHNNIVYILCIYNICFELCLFSSLHRKFQIRYDVHDAKNMQLMTKPKECTVFVEKECHDGNCQIWTNEGYGDEFYRQQVANNLNPHEYRRINGYRCGHLWRKEEIDQSTKGTRPEIFRMYVGILDKVYICLLDSGAEFSSISASVAKELQLPQYPVEKGTLSSKGVGGSYEITHACWINIIFHDLQMSKHIFKINETGTTQFKIIIGMDFLRAFQLIVDPFHLSISRQISETSFWSLHTNILTGLCRRRIHRVPYRLRTGLIPEINRESLYRFDIIIPDIEILPKKICLCSDSLNDLNESVYFHSNYDDLANSKKNDYIISLDTNGDHVPNIEVNDLITNIHNPYFSVIRHDLNTFSQLNEDELVGEVSSILCAEVDKDAKLHMNGSLTIPDIKNSSINFINKTVYLDQTYVLNEDSDDEITKLDLSQTLGNIMKLHEIHVDMKLPIELEKTGLLDDDEEELKDDWSREELISKIKIGATDPKERKEIEDLLFKYKTVFSKTEYTSGADLPSMRIDMLNNIPIYVPQFKIDKTLIKEIEVITEEMLANGLLEASSSPYNSPVMFVRKRPTYTPEGVMIPAKLRLILDLRKINSNSKIFSWPIPSVDSILQQLSGFNTFISSDLINGYYQNLIHPDSRRLLAFSAPSGRFQLTRMPMGHVN